MIFIADDDKDILESYEALFVSAGIPCALFPDGTALLRACEEQSPDLFLLDLRMPPPDGLEVLKRLRERYPSARAIVITGEGDVPSAVEAMKRGALDFLEKPVDGDLLIERVEKILAEPESGRNIPAGNFDALTPREKEIATLLVNGDSNKEAALKLDISYRTVEVHRARIMDKCGASNFSELLRMAVVDGIA